MQTPIAERIEEEPEEQKRWKKLDGTGRRAHLMTTVPTVSATNSLAQGRHLPKPVNRKGDDDAQTDCPADRRT